MVIDTAKIASQGVVAYVIASGKAVHKRSCRQQSAISDSTQLGSSTGTGRRSCRSSQHGQRMYKIAHLQLAWSLPGRASCICCCKPPMDQVAQQESPIPCHITTGSDDELKDVSSLLGRGLYTGVPERGEVKVKNASNTARTVTRVTRNFPRLRAELLVASSTREASTLTSSVMRMYFVEDMLHRHQSDHNACMLTYTSQLTVQGFSVLRKGSCQE